MPWQDWRDTATKGYGSMTVSTTSVDFAGAGLTGQYSGAYGICNNAVINVENGNIRYRVDGGNPSATEGHMVRNGQVFYLSSSEDIQNFKVVRTGPDNATLHITFGVTI